MESEDEQGVQGYDDRQGHRCLYPFLWFQPEQIKHPYNHISFHFPLSTFLFIYN